MLELLPRLWTGEAVEHAGTAYTLPSIELTPAVSHRIPIIVGGHSQRALKRAAGADGWFGPPVSIEETLALTTALTKIRSEIPSANGTFTTYVRLPLKADAGAVAEYRELGFDDLVISPFRGGGLDPTAPFEDLRTGVDALACRLGVS
jgi:alkanesulfonate monooxygenase SsuD/methylene tetrahydromethanopterin reductase-like flavin-dependent oxidoreductase (luciferase family)